MRPIDRADLVDVLNFYEEQAERMNAVVDMRIALRAIKALHAAMLSVDAAGVASAHNTMVDLADEFIDLHRVQGVQGVQAPVQPLFSAPAQQKFSSDNGLASLCRVCIRCPRIPHTHMRAACAYGHTLPRCVNLGGGCTAVPAHPIGKESKHGRQP